MPAGSASKVKGEATVAWGQQASDEVKWLIARVFALAVAFVP